MSPRGRAVATLASTLIVLVLGTGLMQSVHAEEHDDDGGCVECALCQVTVAGPIAEPPFRAEVGTHRPVESFVPAAEALLVRLRSRHREAPRAPPT